MVLEAQRLTLAECLFILEKIRKEKALLGRFREGTVGFAGGLSAGNYAAIKGEILEEVKAA